MIYTGIAPADGTPVDDDECVTAEPVDDDEEEGCGMSAGSTVRLQLKRY